MFVNNYMTRDPRVVAPRTAVAVAVRLMRFCGFHQLPVAAGDRRLMGMVTDRDTHSAAATNRGRDLTVSEIMSTDVVSVTPGATLEEAALLLCEHRFGALPVVEADRVVGIIARHDILLALLDLLGVGSSRHRIEVAIPNGAADIAGVMQSLVGEEGVLSVVAGKLRTDGDEPVLYVHTREPDTRVLERKLQASGAIVLEPEKPILKLATDLFSRCSPSRSGPAAPHRARILQRLADCQSPPTA